MARDFDKKEWDREQAKNEERRQHQKMIARQLEHEADQKQRRKDGEKRRHGKEDT